jgi:two-component system, cell cycle response regulator
MSQYPTLDAPFSEPPAPPRTRPDSPASVLVVEDESIIAKDIERTLVELGYRVTGNVRTGRAALHALEETRPSLILSDIRIKGDLDGIELAAIARERFALPVVFLTSHADESTWARASAIDPYGYVLKPFTPRELRAGLELALRRHAADARLERQSNTDELTGLHNRRGFMMLAEQQLKVATRSKRRVMLVFADLNGMKFVNDTFGHEAGDMLLRDAAKALRLTFRESDILARLGGDEFVALAIEPDGEARDILELRLQATVRKLNEDSSRLHRLSMSVGICAWNPVLHPTLHDLLAEADAKMYEAKMQRRKFGSGSMPVVARAASVSCPETLPAPAAVPGAVPRTLELRCAALAAQARRVARYSQILARGCGYTEQDAVTLGRAAYLRDVGELIIADADAHIDRSTSEQNLEHHTMLGASLLGAAKDDFLQRAAAVALRHHERWDGLGYPDGLRGQEIPLDARIVAVADAFAAMTRITVPDADALETHFRSEAGVQFDPNIVAALIRTLSLLTGPAEAGE